MSDKKTGVINIAIDGPSGAGKSTLAKALSEKLGYVYVDTGALYRSVGFYVKRKGGAATDAELTVKLLPEISLKLVYTDKGQRVILNGEDVSDAIRTPEISIYASEVSKIPQVREFLLDIQKDMASKTNIVMDGRDIGTVILPDADVKIFMTASPEARAHRRCIELNAKGITESYEKVLSEMKYRDANDSGRKIAPAVPASDAVIFDNSDYDIEGMIVFVQKIIGEKLKNAL